MTEQDQPARKRTVLRTVRLPEALSKELEEAAAEDGVSFNSLIAVVLQEYVQWTRKAKKFGFAQVSRNMLRILLAAADSDELDVQVREKYAGVLKDMAMFWYQDASPQNVIRVLEHITQHNWYVDLSKKVEGKKVTLSFRHDMGAKFNLFLKAMLDTAIRNDLRTVPVYEEGESSFTVHFSLP
jgi:predicted DNA-binding ribbon-helix-helix protein